MFNTSKKIINTLLLNFGFQIHYIKKEKSFSNSMEAGLRRISDKLTINTIIDIGAAAGTWTEKCLTIWKDANYVLFEPLEERVQNLKILKDKNIQTNITHIKAAAGNENRKISFSISDDLDGSGIYGAGTLREVDLFRVDDVLLNSSNTGPYILKLDTHGFEIPIFEGATKVLKNTVLIIVEVYGFYVAPNSLLFWEICQYLDAKGFRLFDIVDPMRRPIDEAFWQCDAFFIKKDSFLFNNNSYA